MEFRNRASGAVITDSELRSQFPNTSFPQILTTDVVDAFGFDPVLEGPQAVTTGPYEISVRSGVEQIDGRWFTKYVVGPVFTDYTKEDGTIVTAAEQDAAYRLQKDADQAMNVRSTRNKLLSESDWTQVADSPVNAGVWAAYRQALRDMPSQSGFPWSIEWPEEPA